MAFTTSNVKLESTGSFFTLVGQFTSNKGDANGTVTVGGAIVYMAHAFDSSGTTPEIIPLPVSLSASGNNTNVSINVASGVTAGRFYIVYR